MAFFTNTFLHLAILYFRVKTCQNPYHSIITYGVYVPIIVIGVMLPVVTICLCWDWTTRRRKFFSHVHIDDSTSIPDEVSSQNKSKANEDSRVPISLVEDKLR